jgi:hypothetical protein
MDIVFLRLAACVFFSWMAWSFGKQYLALLRKEGNGYEKMKKYPRVMVFQKFAIPLLMVYFIFLVLVQIVAMYSELT